MSWQNPLPGLRLPGVRAKGIPLVLLLWEDCTSHHYPEDKGARTRPPDRLRQPSSCDPAVCTGWGGRGCENTPHPPHMHHTTKIQRTHTTPHPTPMPSPLHIHIYTNPTTYSPIRPTQTPTEHTRHSTQHAHFSSHTRESHVQGLGPADTCLLPTNPRPATLSHGQA